MTQLRLWPSGFEAGRNPSWRRRRAACRPGLEALETRTVLSASGLSPLFEAPRHGLDGGADHLPPAIHLSAPGDRYGGSGREAGLPQRPALGVPALVTAPAHRAYFATPILASYIGTRSLGGITFDRSEPVASVNSGATAALTVPRANTPSNSSLLAGNLDVRDAQSSLANTASQGAVDSNLLGDRLASTAEGEGSLGSLESKTSDSSLNAGAPLASTKSVLDAPLTYFRTESARQATSTPRETWDAPDNDSTE